MVGKGFAGEGVRKSWQSEERLFGGKLLVF
jgi:hypothetical protein